MGPEDLQALALEFLAACSEAVALAPGGPIGRVLVSPGPPAFDCPEQLSVHVGGPVIAPLEPTGFGGGQRDQLGRVVHLVQLTCTVLRCAPTLTNAGAGKWVPPTAAALTECAAITNGDLWSIWNHVRKLHREGSLFADSGERRREVDWQPAVSVPSQGASAGWQVGVVVRLDGYGG
jgi:hypothetical protein